MDYGEVITRAWRIIWKYKVLWIFGILAGFTAPSTNGSTSAGNQVQYRFGSGEWARIGLDIQNFFNRIPIWVWILLALVGILLFIIAIVLNTIGRIGVIKGASQGDEGVARLSFGPLFSASLPYFWRVFFLNLLVGLAMVILVIVLLILFIPIAILTLGIGLICFICLVIPIGWFIQLLVEQSIIAMIIEDRGIFDGLSRGWQVVTKNLGHMIVIALILFLGGAIVSFLIGLPALAALSPLLVAAIAQTRTAITGSILLSALLFLIYLPFLLILSGILSAYISTAWTLTFRRLTGRGPASMAPVAVPPVTPPSEPPVEPYMPPSSPVEPPASEPVDTGGYQAPSVEPTIVPPGPEPTPPEPPHPADLQRMTSEATIVQPQGLAADQPTIVKPLEPPDNSGASPEGEEPPAPDR